MQGLVERVEGGRRGNGSDLGCAELACQIRLYRVSRDLCASIQQRHNGTRCVTNPTRGCGRKRVGRGTRTGTGWLLLLLHCAPTNRAASSHAFPLVHQLKPDFMATISRRNPARMEFVARCRRCRKHTSKVVRGVRRFRAKKMHVRRGIRVERIVALIVVSFPGRAVRQKVREKVGMWTTFLL